MVKKLKKSQIVRHVIQVISFFMLPGLVAMTFNETRIVYKMIINGKFDFMQALPNLIEFVAVMIITILMGRWFCGWVCAFGAYNDLIYSISKKLFKMKFRVSERADSILKYVKYAVLLFIVIISWTIGSNILNGASPWDAFGQITNISAILSTLLMGLILLIIITIGCSFIERFFCRYLCPLGAIFAIISRIGIGKISKPKEPCGKCRACTVTCSMALKLYKVDGVKGGDCINCLKCTEICPKKNANINVLGQDLNQSLAGSAAVAAMLGVYGITNFGVDALTNAGIISGSSAILSTVSQGNASDTSAPKYKDGTYTGSGQGFGGTTKVSVTIVDGKVTDIKTLSNQDTSDYYSRAFNSISKGIIASQSSDVDTVSGATYSSKGIISAVKDALSQATVPGIDSSNSNTESATKDETGNSNAASNQTADSKDPTPNPAVITQDVPFDNSQKKYKDGTYTGSGQGFEGVTKVSVNVSNGKITNIATLSEQDTAEFYQKASSGIMSKIISTQSPNVDTVSGATYSSKGIINAVKNALNQALVSTSSSNASSDETSGNQGSSGSSSYYGNASSSVATAASSAAGSKAQTAPSSSVSNQQSGSSGSISESTSSGGSSASTGKAISNGNTSTIGNGQYKDGTYTGKGSGFGGTTKISVVIANGKITGISTISEEDTSSYYNRAIKGITSSVISTQSASVDTVSGATHSSDGIIEAIKDALSQAK